MAWFSSKVSRLDGHEVSCQSQRHADIGCPIGTRSDGENVLEYLYFYDVFQVIFCSREANRENIWMLLHRSIPKEVILQAIPIDQTRIK